MFNALKARRRTGRERRELRAERQHVEGLLWDCDLCDREFPVVLGTAVGTEDAVSLLCPLCVNGLGGDGGLRPAGEWETLFRSHEAEDTRDLDSPDPADVATACELCSKPSDALTVVDEGCLPRNACPDCAEALKAIVAFGFEQSREGE